MCLLNDGPNTMINKRFFGLLAVLNTGLFGLAALVKSRHLHTLVTAIDKTYLFPDFASTWVAGMVIGSEALILVGLLVPKTRRQAMMLALGLSTIFLFYQFWRIHSKIDEDCGCFGDLFVLTPLQTVLLDAAMIVSQCIYLAATGRQIETDGPKLPKANSLAFVDACIVTVTVAVSSLFLIGATRNQANSPSGAAPQIVPTHASLRRIIGENVKAYPFTLIEFGDFQCPPCRAEYLVVRPLLEKYRSRLRFVFHDYPLIGIHPLAQRAAEIHAAAMRTGSASQVHDELMRNPLEDAFLTRLEQKVKIDRALDTMSVEKDVRLAMELGVKQTPTFFIYSDDGRLILLDSALQIERHVRIAEERR